MKSNENIKKLLLIDFFLLVAWLVIVFVFADYEKAKFYFWGGLVFGVVSFMVAGLSLLLIQMKANPNTTEINYIPVYYTIIYLFLSLAVNTYFVFRLAGKLNVLLVILNVIFLAVLLALRLFTDDYVTRVDEQSNHLVEKIVPITMITSKLASILSMVSDPEIKKQLHTLKEIVDYSSNVSQQSGGEQQKLFLLQLEQLETMIAEQKENEEIRQKIQEATTTWKKRNSLVSTTK